MHDQLAGLCARDGGKGIRNTVVVAYLVECAHHVARAVTTPFEGRGVNLIGFGGCYPNGYAQDMMDALATHPNVGAVLLVSLGCEEFNRQRLKETIARSGRPVELLVIQRTGGTRATVEAGRAWVEQQLQALEVDAAGGHGRGRADRRHHLRRLGRHQRAHRQPGHRQGGRSAGRRRCQGDVRGAGRALRLRAGHGRGAPPRRSWARRSWPPWRKSHNAYGTLDQSSFGGGNISGGLSTIEEKSIGAYTKSGTRPIVGLLKPGVRPTRAGLYLSDMIGDGPVRFGFPNINDNAEITEMIACGAHLTLFSTGRGSVVGSAIAPVIKICANPETYRRMTDDMDVDAGRILEGRGTLDEVGREIVDLVERIAGGEPTRSEALGHQEFVLTYKTFEPLGPACLPA